MYEAEAVGSGRSCHYYVTLAKSSMAEIPSETHLGRFSSSYGFDLETKFLTSVLCFASSVFSPPKHERIQRFLSPNEPKSKYHKEPKGAMSSQETFELATLTIEEIFQDRPYISGDTSSLFFENTILSGQKSNETFWVDQNDTSQCGSQS